MITFPIRRQGTHRCREDPRAFGPLMPSPQRLDPGSGPPPAARILCSGWPRRWREDPAERRNYLRGSNVACFMSLPVPITFPAGSATVIMYNP